MKITDALIFNKDEAMLLSKEKDTEKVLKKLKKFGAKIIVITDGPNKVFAYDGKHIYSLKPRKIKVVEVTGSGDAFASGFIAGMIKKTICCFR